MIMDRATTEAEPGAAPDETGRTTGEGAAGGLAWSGPGAAVDPPPSDGRKRGKGRRKRIAWALAAAISGALLLQLLRADPLEVESVRVGRGPLETTISSDGVTRVSDRYRVVAPISGLLERLALREGDLVEAGTALARITPAPLDPQALLQARSHLTGAQAMLDEANVRVRQTLDVLEQTRRTTSRIRAVAWAGGLSREAIERAELELASAEREHQAAQSRARAATSEVSAARAALLSLDPEGGRGSGVAVVRSPATGRVLRVPDPSERVMVAGTPLLEIGDPSGLEVVVDVLSTDAVKIPPGAPMRLTGWGGDGALDARVLRIEPSAFTRVSALGVEEQRVNVIGQLVAPPASLGDGYRVEAQIVTWSSPDVLKVPTGALFRTGETWSVFVAEDGRARLRALTLGRRGTAEAEVLEGLRAGEAVILFPSDGVTAGARVRAR